MGHRNEDGVGDETAEEESIESLLNETNRPTEEVVDALRKSGPRRHVSDRSVDEILADVSHSRSAESSDGLALSGEPRRTVSTTGIDEIFETLEAEAPPLPPEPEFDDSPDLRSVRDASTQDTRDGATDSSAGDRSDDDDSFGTLAGGDPTRTVSDQSVDDILELVEDGPDADDSETEDPRRDASDLRPDDPEAELVALLTGDEPAGPDDATTAPPLDDEPSDEDASRTNSASASRARRGESRSEGDETRRLNDASGTTGGEPERDADDCDPDVSGRNWLSTNY